MKVTLTPAIAASIIAASAVAHAAPISQLLAIPVPDAAVDVTTRTDTITARTVGDKFLEVLNLKGCFGLCKPRTNDSHLDLGSIPTAQVKTEPSHNSALQPEALHNSAGASHNRELLVETSPSSALHLEPSSSGVHHADPSHSNVKMATLSPAEDPTMTAEESLNAQLSQYRHKKGLEYPAYRAALAIEPSRIGVLEVKPSFSGARHNEPSSNEIDTASPPPPTEGPIMAAQESMKAQLGEYRLKAAGKPAGSALSQQHVPQGFLKPPESESEHKYKGILGFAHYDTPS